ncbi:MAG: efflux RND transporter periplasmic adaptor subunit [Lentisphaeria bacterium]|jgi:RND family efflux transporter MFP subunit|nr:efflux RND transporter periplasmic adaptor subunit [Lentisphaeria bacterium]MBQ8755085.1 efflux RND transporter periplasmic adaptor subunit [Lentisphaeria bacterium]MBQ9776212.1 efflux RND transporter periplasmic adaptor subunit [Lentisphaeria bacterium]
MSKQILLLSVAFLTFLPLAGETVKAVLFPFREAEISSRVDSTLQNCKFRIGEKFKAGDVLIELDSTPFSLQVQRNTVHLQFTGSAYQDKKELKRNNLTSDFELQKAEFEYKTAQTALKEAELRLSYCRISAPFPGKIVEVLKQEHEIVKAGEPLLKIIDDSFLFAVVNFPLKKVKPTGAVLKLKLENDTIVNGKIYEISPQVNHRTGTLRLRILIDNAAGTLRAGMTGEVINAE